MIRKLLTVTIAAMAFASVQGVASANPAPQKELCKNGGYADYVDPTTNLPFKNQGRCVSFVNAGGTLVPVQDEPPVTVTVEFVQWYLLDQSAPDCMLLWIVQAEPGSQVVYEASSVPGWSNPLTVPPEGTLYGYSPPVPNGGTVTLAFNGQEYVTPVAAC